MATILILETATKVCSVALAKDGQLVAIQEAHEERFTHAENLNVFVAEVLKLAGSDFKDLDAIAVSGGPGSYTGLRIGVSAAKGYCHALNIPLIAVDTLRAMASGVEIESGVIIHMIDARRMEVFCSVFDKDHNELEAVSAAVLDENSYSQYSDHTIYLLGDGATKFTDLNKALTTVNLYQYPSAGSMISLVETAYKQQIFVDTAYYEPFYLKDFVAGKPKKMI